MQEDNKKNSNGVKILSIGSDKNLFKENSAVRLRIIEYGSFVEELHIVVFSKKNFSNTQIAKNIFLYPTNSSSKWFYPFDAVKIGKKIINEKERWLITVQDPFEAGLAGFLIKRKSGVPLHLQIHCDFLSPYFAQESLLNKIRVWLAKFLLSKTDKIRVVSERIMKSLISQFSNFPISRVSILPIFVDVKKIQEDSIKINLHEKYSQFNFIILIASRLVRVKNICLAIEAMSEVIKSYPKTGLIIVGDGKEEESLRSKVKNLKLLNNIIFESWNNDLSSYYKTADLFLLISNHEGYGMATIEAMAAGCPLIMTDVGCAGELVKNEYNGLVIPIGSREELVKNIGRIISEPSLRDKLKNNGLATVKNLPTKEEYLNSYKESWEMR